MSNLLFFSLRSWPVAMDRTVYSTSLITANEKASHCPAFTRIPWKSVCINYRSHRHPFQNDCVVTNRYINNVVFPPVGDNNRFVPYFSRCNWGSFVIMIWWSKLFLLYSSTFSVCFSILNCQIDGKTNKRWILRSVKAKRSIVHYMTRASETEIGSS